MGEKPLEVEIHRITNNKTNALIAGRGKDN